MIDVDVRVSGALFDGRAAAAVDQYLDAAEQAVATEGVNEVQRILGTVLRNPTGFYQSRIATDHVQGDHVVNDSGVIYGPWLAVGAYTPRTSFPGYGAFRQATQRLQARAAQIAERELPAFIQKMNR